MKKQFSFIFFLLTVALLVQANAQTGISSEKKAAIQELVSLINADNKAEEIVNVLGAQSEATREAAIKSIIAERTDLTQAEKKSLEESMLAEKNNYSKRFRDKLLLKLNYNEMINEIAAIVYDKYFTLEEIR